MHPVLLQALHARGRIHDHPKFNGVCGKPLLDFLVRTFRRMTSIPGCRRLTSRSRPGNNVDVTDGKLARRMCPRFILRPLSASSRMALSCEHVSRMFNNLSTQRGHTNISSLTGKYRKSKEASSWAMAGWHRTESFLSPLRRARCCRHRPRPPPCASVKDSS